MVLGCWRRVDVRWHRGATGKEPWVWEFPPLEFRICCGFRYSDFEFPRRTQSAAGPNLPFWCRLSSRLDQPLGLRRKFLIHGTAGQVRQSPSLQQRVARMAAEAAHTPLAHFDAPYHTGRRLYPQLRQPQQARYRWRQRPEWPPVSYEPDELRDFLYDEGVAATTVMLRVLSMPPKTR